MARVPRQTGPAPNQFDVSHSMKYTLTITDDKSVIKSYDSLDEIVFDCELIDWDNGLYDVRDENGIKYVPMIIYRTGLWAFLLGDISGYELVPAQS